MRFKDQFWSSLKRSIIQLIIVAARFIFKILNLLKKTYFSYVNVIYDTKTWNNKIIFLHGLFSCRSLVNFGESTTNQSWLYPLKERSSHALWGNLKRTIFDFFLILIGFSDLSLHRCTYCRNFRQLPNFICT